jgi:hypothetical protein
MLIVDVFITQRELHDRAHLDQSYAVVIAQLYPPWRYHTPELRRMLDRLKLPV